MSHNNTRKNDPHHQDRLKRDALEELEINGGRYTDMGFSVPQTSFIQLPDSVAQTMGQLHRELEIVDEDTAETIARIHGSLRDQDLEEWRLLKEILPKIHTTEQTIQDAIEHHQQVVTDLIKQKHRLLNRLSVSAKEKANDFLHVDGTIYRLTAQGKVVAIDVACVDEQIHDLTKDER